MKKTLVLVFTFLLCSITVFGQTEPTLTPQQQEKYIPPSPTVAELGKYGRIPISHYTGVPNISIPIHTIECGSLSLPILLSYHASGIRVDQLASWVGMGWSLNAGGVINVAVMGEQDLTKVRMDAEKFWEANQQNYTKFPTLNDAEMLTRYKLKDAAPDIYSYVLVIIRDSLLRILMEQSTT